MNQVLQPPTKTYVPIEDLESLREHLQWALCVELSTIPPYLCALYSIVDPTTEAYRLVRSVAVEEMLHTMLVCNLMNAIGRRPSFSQEYIPKYPGFIPHHAAGGPFIQLQPLSPPLVRTVFMAIEQPETSPHVPAEGENFHTIGQFYKAIEEGFERCVERYGPHEVFGHDTGFQRMDTYFGGGGGHLVHVRDLHSAKQAIQEITEQGEGATHPQPPEPGQQPFGGYDHYGERADGTYGPILGVPWEMSHYRKFQQIADGDVPLPEVYPMIPDPAPERFPPEIAQLAETFDACYTLLIVGLQKAFATDDATASFFGTAFPIMREVLPNLAALLMQTTLEPAADPSLGPTAGPAFLYRSWPIEEIVKNLDAMAERPARAGAEYLLLWKERIEPARAAMRAILSGETAGEAELRGGVTS